MAFRPLWVSGSGSSLEWPSRALPGREPSPLAAQRDARRRDTWRAMSQANVDLLLQAAALANAGDLDAVAELYHPDAELRDLQHPPDAPEVLRGRTAIVAA